MHLFLIQISLQNSFIFKLIQSKVCDEVKIDMQNKRENLDNFDT